MNKVTLSSEQIQKIRQESKTESDLPVYYKSEIEPKASISRLYEAHLILKDSKLKRDAIDWLDYAISLVNGEDENRSELYKEFLNNRRVDNNSQLKEIEEEIIGFNTFRSAFITGVAEPLELSPMFRDINIALNQLQTIKSVQEHLRAIVNLLSGNIG
jgi:hypothetical protein